LPVWTTSNKFLDVPRLINKFCTVILGVFFAHTFSDFYHLWITGESEKFVGN